MKGCKIGFTDDHLNVSCTGTQSDLEKEILRVGMRAELDAISLYEQLASASQNPKIQKVILDIAKEEKTHMGEFQTLLLTIDQEQKEELEMGRKEVAKLSL